jgi:RNA polymerase primary sigma factor
VVQEPQSLDSFRNEGELPGALYFLADPNAADPLDRTLSRELKEKMQAALGVLDEREEQIIRLRFGIGHDEAHTLEEIGRVVNLSRERVRQIEGLALRKILMTRLPHHLGRHISEN